MGTWGTGIYSNDVAEDVREACKDIFAYYDIDEGNQELFRHFHEILEQDFIDNDYVSFWYSLADWQWKHGMLNDFVKEKSLILLESYAGIEEWNELGNGADINKRKKVLDLLKKQLQTPQPVQKKPKVNCVRAKHQVGEIVVFRVAYNEESVWKKESFSVPFIFKSPEISNSKYEDICGYNAQGKYMAILCVGTEKEIHSEYIPNMYDEHSIYVWYDYLSEVEPSVEVLGKCGFLPFVDLHWEDFNRNIVSNAEWIYKFVLCYEKFNKSNGLLELKNYISLSEVERFNTLISFKNYSDNVYGGFSLSDMFSVVFEEKNRMEILNMHIDNLLNFNITNPEILLPHEIKKEYNKYLKRLQKQT